MTSQRLTASGRWSLVAGAGAIVVGSALWAGQVGPWIGRKPDEGSSGGTDRLATEMQTVTVSLRPPTVSAPASAVSGSSVAALLYVLGAVLLVAMLFMVAWFLRQRPDAVDRSRPALTSEPPLVGEPLPESDPVFDVRVGADYVISCWEHLETCSAAAGLPRRRQQTPTEFLEALAAHAPIDRAAADELLRLYQRARFDHVTLPPDTAVRARECLHALLFVLPAAVR